MADLESLEKKSISEMSPDEAIEHLRQIRLSRRVPVKKVQRSTPKTSTRSKPAPKLNAEQAAKLLKSLGEE